jgi:hypothetical protein
MHPDNPTAANRGQVDRGQPLGSDLNKPSYVLRDPFKIHPDESSLVQKTIAHIFAEHHELEITPWKMVKRAWSIGAELIALKQKIYRGQWSRFCETKLAPMSLRKIGGYMQLAEYKDRLLAKYRNRNSFDFDQLPPIREVLADIQGWRREERYNAGKAPIKHKSAGTRKRPECFRLTRKQFEALCPDCRKILESGT